MAQLKVKQISDFVTAVASVHNGTAGTQTTTDIAAAKSEAIASAVSADVVLASDAIVSAVSQAEAKDVSRAATAAAATSDALVSAVSQAEAKDVSRAATGATLLSDAVAVEKLRAETAEGLIDGRVTTLLGGSTEALDTFGEIKTFIDGLAAEDVTTIAAISTAVANDIVHSTAIATSLSVAIANDVLAQGYADAAEADAIASALSSSIVKADAAEASAISSAEAKDGVRAATAATNLSNAISTEVSDRNTAIGVLDNDLQTQINALTSVANEEEIAVFRTITSFGTVATYDLNGHVAVFVNGLQVHEAVGAGDGWISADGINFTVQGLGYDLEAGDHIIVTGKLV